MLVLEARGFQGSPKETQKASTTLESAERALFYEHDFLLRALNVLSDPTTQAWISASLRIKDSFVCFPESARSSGN